MLYITPLVLNNNLSYNLKVCTFWWPSSNSPSPPLPSLFVYFWSIIDLQHHISSGVQQWWHFHPLQRRRHWHPTPVLSPGKSHGQRGAGGLQSMGSLRVGHDWATSLSLFTFMHWRRKWQPTPVLLAGESQGRGSLVGCRLWGCTELDMTEAT